MRKVLPALFIFAMSALAADFTGNWTGEGVADGQAHPLYVVIKQDGNTLSGTAGPDASRQAEIHGKVEGDKVSFDVATQGPGSIHFELKAEGDALKGTVEFKRDDGSQSAAVSLTKAAS